jgi:hypothetical protein
LICCILNRAGLPEAGWFKLCGHGWLVQHGVILLLGFGWRDVADGLQKPSMVEPVDPFRGGEFNRFEAAPRSAPMDDLCLVVDRSARALS